MPDFDVVIVGSGPGGATAADVLTAAGKSVCILEKGRNHLLALDPPFANLGHLSNDEIKFDRRHFLGPDPLLEPRTYRRAVADGDRTFTGDVNNMPSTVGGGGYPRRRQAARASARSTSVSPASSGPVDGADVVDWPVDYDEMEPYYAEAERSIGVAGDHTGNPFAAWRADPYPMPPGADMFLTMLTARRRDAARLPPVPRADRREQRRLRRPARVQQLRLLRVLRVPDRREGRPGRAAPTRAAHRAAARSGPRASRSRSSSTAPGSRAGACATSTPTARQHEVSPPTRSSSRAARSRRRDSCCAAASATRRISSAATSCSTCRRSCSATSRSGCTRYRGPRRHPPHGRPDRRRRRERGRGEGGRRALHPRRHRRARRQRPPDHRGVVHAARARAQRAHGASRTVAIAWSASPCRARTCRSRRTASTSTPRCATCGASRSGGSPTRRTGRGRVRAPLGPAPRSRPHRGGRALHRLAHVAGNAGNDGAGPAPHLPPLDGHRTDG